MSTTRSYIYVMQGVSKVVPPKRELLKNINLSFYYGAKIGVLGLNGSGKSTLMRILAGEDKEFTGEARPANGVKIGYLPQEPRLDTSKTVRENIEAAFGESGQWLRRYNAISDAFADPDLSAEKMTELLEEQASLQEKIDAADLWDLDHKIEIAADALRLPPLDEGVEKLSGGEKRRVALCCVLMSNPDILLLDEPTNHLDAESVAWLERFLHDFKGTVIAVTHDRYFLDNVAGWILELDRGRGIPYEGNYSAWLEQKEKRLAQEEKQEDAHRRALKQELEWVRSGTKGRQAKGKARLARYEELNSREFQQRNETNELYIPPGPRLGDMVVEATNLTKRFGDRVIFEGLTCLIPPGAVVGIIGANGAGKSTFFNILSGKDTADSGELRIGESVSLAMVDQSRDTLDDSKTIWQEISGGLDMMKVGAYEMASRSYVGKFNFKGNDQQKLIKDASGGERNRVHMAKVLSKGGNVILLDEPTNDLDVETLRALEEAIQNFPGCVFVISHDRWFLDRIATHILAYEGDSKVEFYYGNYTEYEEDRLRRLGPAAMQPHRIKYKQLKT